MDLARSTNGISLNTVKRRSVVNNIGYYACQVSLDVINEEVETADGYLLR